MRILSSKKPVFFLIVLGCLLSFYGYWMVENERTEKIQSAFDEIVSEETAALQRSLDDYFDEVYSLQSFYLSSEFVSREEFHQFAGRILKRLGGIQALEWVPLVTDERRAEFEEAVRQEGFPEFKITEIAPDGQLQPAGPREKYFPVTYVEPFEGNEKAFGFDFSSEENRAKALAKAVENRSFSVISSLSAVQKKDSKFLVSILPVYSPMDAGKEQLKGVLLGVFQLDAVIEKELFKGHGGRKSFCFTVFDVTDAGSPQKVYASRDTAPMEVRGLPAMTSEKKFEINGHDWKITASPCARWLEDRRAGLGPLSVLLAGIGATLLFGLYLSLYIDRTKTIESAVAIRTAELAKANEQISISERTFRGLVANIPGAIYRCALDKDWTMDYITDEIEKISGYPASDFVGSKARSFASIIHPDDVKKVEEDVQKAVDARRPYILEYRVLDSKGNERWIYEKGQAIFSSEGQVLYLDGAIFDITERKKLSERLLQSRKMEAIGKLSGGIAHDFNNQLMVILGYCDLLLEAKDLPGGEREKITDMKLAAEKSSLLVRQLLAFGKRQILTPSVFEPNTLIKNLENMARTLLGENIILDLKLAADLKTIRMDPIQMEQVLLNMIVNARDAMPRGGRLVIESQNVHVDEEEKPDLDMAAGDYVLLAVKDNGEGISDEAKPHLFEPFFTTKPKNKGTGLGLATCYGIIRGAGGVIQVQSQAGKGAIFLIYIPASMDAATERKKEVVRKDIPGGHETILLVEDEEKVRRITGLILRNRGYRVLEFSGGEEALAFLKTHRGQIDLLLTDVIMPGMDGGQVARAVKELRPEIRVIFMSGYLEDTLMRHGIAHNQLNFLHKPSETADLCGKVRAILDQKTGPMAGRAAA